MRGLVKLVQKMLRNQESERYFCIFSYSLSGGLIGYAPLHGVSIFRKIRSLRSIFKDKSVTVKLFATPIRVWWRRFDSKFPTLFTS